MFTPTIPSWELTYPPKKAFWRWFSFSRLVGYVNPLEGTSRPLENPPHQPVCCTHVFAPTVCVGCALMRSSLGALVCRCSWRSTSWTSTFSGGRRDFPQMVVSNNFFMFTPNLGEDVQLNKIFFKWVETTNQFSPMGFRFSRIGRWANVIRFRKCGKGWEFLDKMVVI